MTAASRRAAIRDNGPYVRRIDRLHQAAGILGATCFGLSVAFIGLSVWLALLPLAFWTGWIQLASP